MGWLESCRTWGENDMNQSRSRISIMWPCDCQDSTWLLSSTISLAREINQDSGNSRRDVQDSKTWLNFYGNQTVSLGKCNKRSEEFSFYSSTFIVHYEFRITYKFLFRNLFIYSLPIISACRVHDEREDCNNVPTVLSGYYKNCFYPIIRLKLFQALACLNGRFIFRN